MEIKNDEPIRMWPGTVILRCPPCSWDKCVFCGYSRECLAKLQPATDEFLKQLDSYLNEYGFEAHLEIYNSGSFLDDAQVSPGSRLAIFKHLAKAGTKSVTIESRPEFITKKNLEPLTKAFKGFLTVAIGLEVADDEILKKLNKGFGLEDIERAYSVLNAFHISSRVYILVGPPFVDDPKTTALESVRYAKDIGFTEISLLAAYPMENSEGDQLWKKGDWTPIEKSDFDEIIQFAKKIEPDIDYSSDGLEKFWEIKNGNSE